MKKGNRYSGIVLETEFPNKGIVEVKEQSDDGTVKTEKVVVKNALPGQTVSFVVNKKRGGKCEGRLKAVEKRSELERPELACREAGVCGGCLYQGFPYEETLKIKEGQVKKLLADFVREAEYDGITASPLEEGYRNKMEYTFGDAMKGGELTLGLHKRGSFYDICSAGRCRIADEDFGSIVTYTEGFFRKRGIPYYHRQWHDGILRHLLVRKAAKTGEILVAIVSVSGEKDLMERADEPVAGAGLPASRSGSDEGGAGLPASRIGSDEGGAGVRAPENEMREADSYGIPATDRDDRERMSEWSRVKEKILSDWCEGLRALPLRGKLAGALHIENDHLADAILCDRSRLLFGQDHFTEELLGLKFRISPFSFFQTNSLGAELLYSRVRDYVSADGNGATIYDLYSGTGTIAQLLAPAAKKVIGVEIVEEAVAAARENAKGNRLENCEFIAGDVLKVLDEIEEKPDYIILDPPRDGVHPKALRKILDYGVERMVYISCKPTSLQRDLPMFTAAGYRVERWGMTDMFPFTGNIETVVLLRRKKVDGDIEVNLETNG